MSRAVMQQALEALEGWDNHDKWVWPESAFEQARRNTKEALAALRAALAEPEQEPVAWVECDGKLVWNNREAAIGRILYTAPTPRRPLTDEEIVTMYAENPSSDAEMIEFARAIERAHGIGEQDGS